MPSLPSWTVPGVVAEVRELTAKSDGKVFAYVVKVTAWGGTYETQTRDKNLLTGLAVGLEVVATGGFELFNGNLKMIATKYVVAK